MSKLPTPEYWGQARSHHNDLIKTAYDGRLLLVNGWAYGGTPEEPVRLDGPSDTRDATVVEWVGTRVGALAIGLLAVRELSPVLGGPNVRTLYAYGMPPRGRGRLAVHTALETHEPDDSVQASSLEADLDSFYNGLAEVRAGLRPSEDQREIFLAELQRGASGEYV